MCEAREQHEKCHKYSDQGISFIRVLGVEAHRGLPEVQAETETYLATDSVICIRRKGRRYELVMKSSSLFQGSRPGLFYDVSMGEFYPLRIPLDRLGAAASPTDTP